MAPTIVRVKDTWTEAGIKSNDKQRAFAEACERDDIEEIIFSGSIRAGKSQAAAKKQVRWAWQYPGTTHLAVRKTFPQLRDSTMGIYLKGDGGMPAALPYDLIEQERKADFEVHLKNKSKIIFRSAENPKEAMANIRNVTLASVFIDQIEELDRDEDPELYETWLSRLSDPRGPRKLLAVANPGPLDHFIYKRGHPDSDEREPQVAWIDCTIYDNAHNLPPGYVSRQERRGRKDPMWFERFCLGKWGAFGGKRFKTWNPNVHVIPPFKVPTSWEVIAGLDYGWHNPTRLILLAVDYAERYYVIGEFSVTEAPPRVIARGIRELEQELNAAPSVRWADPSIWAAKDGQPSIAEQLGEYDLDIGKADNDRIGGWARIDDLLQRTVDGDPLVAGDKEDSQVPKLRFFDGACPELMKELPSARIKDGTEDIEKKNDHSLDALRYCVNGRPPAPEEDDDEDDDPREAYAKRRLARAYSDGADDFDYSI